MMVSGDRRAWREVEDIVRAAAPASFYGGCRVEWANAMGVAVVTVLASVRMVRSSVVLPHLFSFVCMLIPSCVVPLKQYLQIDSLDACMCPATTAIR
jgi:hypothetical protein